MKMRPWSARFALWAAVCAVLLKAAMPMLATASAHAQGKALVEVCTVYGVSTVALDTGGSEPSPQHGAGHAADHCALTALQFVASPAADAAAPLLASPEQAAGTLAPAASLAPDACAAWVAGLKHGPPSIA